MCSCDPGFHGDTCTPSQSYPNYMKEGFPLVDTVLFPDSLPVLDTFVKRKFVKSIYEPRSEKTGLQGFRPGPTETGLCGRRRWLEAENF